MPDDQSTSEPRFWVQLVALLVGIVWIACILITGIAGCFVCGYLADLITPNSGPDSFFVQCCVTVGGVVGAIAGGYFATRLARAIRRRYSKTSRGSQ
jgi:uncharacterized membrane protein YeaQ/YmgE (transglycosylase-associated protein family)